ncbi:MAG: hypothetical protein ACJAXN_001944 [Psychromonas sp.]
MPLNHIQARKKSSCAIIGISKGERQLLLSILSTVPRALIESDPAIKTKFSIQYVNNDLVFPNLSASNVRSIITQVGLYL